jgi:cephalosporin hydroxylase
MNDFKDFEENRQDNIRKSTKNQELMRLGYKFVEESSQYQYSYNFDWLGLPIIQYPQDIIAIQEIIWKIKPDLIIETGVARGGSLIFYSSILELIGKKGKVIGVEIDLRKHNKENILAHPLSRNISFVEGSSIDEDVFKTVKNQIKENDKVLVILDSNHTHDHVLSELQLYSSLVTMDSYVIVMDTSIDYMPDNYFPDRSWGPNNNPRTAVKEFIAKNDSFEIDAQIHNKLIISVAYDGYLKRIK